MSDPARLKGRYYLRFMVDDHPGVLAAITGVLGRHGISIASVIQHEPSDDGHGAIVPLVIMTHTADDGDAAEAVTSIDRLVCVRPGSVRLRVLK
jgi:homoserine dehydrogenase